MPDNDVDIIEIVYDEEDHTTALDEDGHFITEGTEQEIMDIFIGED